MNSYYLPSYVGIFRHKPWHKDPGTLNNEDDPWKARGHFFLSCSPAKIHIWISSNQVDPPRTLGKFRLVCFVLRKTSLLITLPPTIMEHGVLESWKISLQMGKISTSMNMGGRVLLMMVMMVMMMMMVVVMIMMFDEVSWRYVICWSEKFIGKSHISLNESASVNLSVGCLGGAIIRKLPCLP